MSVIIAVIGTATGKALSRSQDFCALQCAWPTGRVSLFCSATPYLLSAGYNSMLIPDRVNSRPRARQMKLTDSGLPPIDLPGAPKTAGVQVTVQRLAVCPAVEATPHANVDETTQAVRQEPCVISRQVVYAAMKLMSEHRLLCTTRGGRCA